MERWMFRALTAMVRRGMEIVMVGSCGDDGGQIICSGMIIGDYRWYVDHYMYSQSRAFLISHL